MRQLDRDARRLLRSFEPSPEERITAAVSKLLKALEADEGSISVIYRSALTRHGENLAKAGGVEAMRAALEEVCAARPDRADQRRATVTAAWAAIEGSST